MAEFEIVETTLQDGETGQCAYLEVDNDLKMVVDADLVSGTTYTLSFFIKAQSDTEIDLIGGMSNTERVYCAVKDYWMKFKVTFKSNGQDVALYFPVGQYYMYALKLEEGTIATTWTASLNDTQTETESIIDQKADSIELRVEETVMERVGEDFVEKDNIIAEINAKVDPTTHTSEVQINAGAINLNGAISANETFKISTSGYMEATGGKIGGYTIYENGLSCGGLDEGTSVDIDNNDGIRHIGYMEDMASGYTTLHEYQEDYSESGYGLKYSVIDFRKLMLSNRQTTSTLKLDGSTGNITSVGKITTSSDIKGGTVKTTSGANLDGNVKCKQVGSATGTSSTLPTVDISSIPAGSELHISVGIKISTDGTIAWFEKDITKPSVDHLYNIGGYYYGANYYASIFANVSNTRVTLNSSWSKVVGGTSATNIPLKASTTQMYVYTTNL